MHILGYKVIILHSKIVLLYSLYYVLYIVGIYYIKKLDYHIFFNPLSLKEKIYWFAIENIPMAKVIPPLLIIQTNESSSSILYYEEIKIQFETTLSLQFYIILYHLLYNKNWVLKIVVVLNDYLHIPLSGYPLLKT